MIIALPSTDHDHLADALVRDLGFARTHVDQPLRDLLLALDPYVDSGLTMANRGYSPRLSSKLEQLGGHDIEDRWNRLLNPPRPGAKSDQVATEVRRLLDVLRHDSAVQGRLEGVDDDTVIVGMDEWAQADARSMGMNFKTVAIRGRFGGDPNHWIAPAGVVGEQEAIVAMVRELRQLKPSVRHDNSGTKTLRIGDDEFSDAVKALSGPYAAAVGGDPDIEDQRARVDE